MSKVDNNNNYNYNQALGEEDTGWRKYIISRSEIWAWSLDQKSSYGV